MNSLDDAVLRSDDLGTTWHRGASLEAADLAVDPDDPRRVLVTTAASSPSGRSNDRT
ncbi:hypothetical protein [Pseudonocardia sp. H11422]|uniref:hypothetical protein n=1 Tax=Pseudonocardia sp. H11422 TaxID=2835866 RepID=UPI001BDD0640|nr:hypothetical protein [Pseudonocardia sp. H11422]